MAKPRESSKNVNNRGLVLLNKTDFSNTSTVSIDNVFSADYTNYRIILDDLYGFTSNQEFRFYLRVGGSDLTASQYNWHTLIANGSSVTAGRTTNSNYGRMSSVGYTAGQNYKAIELGNPFTTKSTTFQEHTMQDATGTGTIIQFYYGYIANSNSYDGIKFYGATYNITGTVSVYGYKDGV